MTITTAFLIYAALFRLAVIAAGALAIYLGYRLFSTGMQDPAKPSTAEARAKLDAVEIRFLVRNAAPGTVFALFGAVIISMMLAQGNPELVVEDLQAAVAADETKAAGRIRLKGGGEDGQVGVDGIGLLQQFGDERLAQGDSNAALAAYGQLLALPELTLREAAPILSGAAGTYLQQGRPHEALPLARLAVGLDEDSTAGLTALAKALEATGDWDGAMAALERVVTIDVSLAGALDALRSRRP